VLTGTHLIADAPIMVITFKYRCHLISADGRLISNYMHKKTFRFNVEKKTLAAMLSIYCRKMHADKEELCSDCDKLQNYAMQKLEKCIFGAKKPNCVHCPVHCYEPAMREQIQKVMRFSGPLMLKYHPILAVVHIAGRLRKRSDIRPKVKE